MVIKRGFSPQIAQCVGFIHSCVIVKPNAVACVDSRFKNVTRGCNAGYVAAGVLETMRYYADVWIKFLLRRT